MQRNAQQSEPLARLEHENHSPPFYRDVVATMADAQIACLIGGAYALAYHTGIARDTKDLDLFLRRRDIERALGALKIEGFRTELTHPHFLGKAYCGDHFADLIFSSGNAVAQVDDEWFENGIEGQLFGLPVKFCSIEDSLWSKAFIMERERYDGADMAHLLRAGSAALDWSRLLARFDRHWRVLLAHLILFEFIYPGERHRIPRHVIRQLVDRLRLESEDSTDSDLCQGTLLSREQYLFDLQVLGMNDARLRPIGNMSVDEIERWTAAIDDPD